MLDAHRRIAALSCGVLAFLTIPVMPAWAQAPPAPPDDRRGWQIELYAGPLVSTRSGFGLRSEAPEVELFTAFNGRPSAYVPTWYFGDGALLLSAVNTALVIDPGITELDPTLQNPMIERRHGWNLGSRIARRLNNRWSLEMAVGIGTGGLEITEDAKRGIEATRASFASAWQSFLTRSGHTVSSISSVAAFEPGSTRRMLLSGALQFQLMPGSRLRPYLTAGGGLVSTFGDLPRATLTGRYQFIVDGISPVDETDLVVMRFDLSRHAPAVVAGAGVTYDRGANWGVRGDIRAHVMNNSIDNLVDTRPLIRVTPGARAALAAPDTYLTVQHSTVAGALSSLATGVTDVQMYSGRGSVAQIGFTAGIFWRFWVADITPAALLDRIERGDAPAILDVRTGAEYERGHVPGAVNVPFTSLLFGSKELPIGPDQEVVVYCGHGPRARIAGGRLRKRGFKNIRYLAGHMRKWARDGRPITIGNR